MHAFQAGVGDGGQATAASNAQALQHAQLLGQLPDAWRPDGASRHIEAPQLSYAGNCLQPLICHLQGCLPVASEGLPLYSKITW